MAKSKKQTAAASKVEEAAEKKVTEFRFGQPVLVRNTDADGWQRRIFAHTGREFGNEVYYTQDGLKWFQCKVYEE